MVAEQNLLLHIRQATKALHEQLDSCYPFITMQSSEVSPNSYHTMLKILYLWHRKVSPHFTVAAKFLHLCETNFLSCRNDLESDLGYTKSASNHNQYSLPQANMSDASRRRPLTVAGSEAPAASNICSSFALAWPSFHSRP